MASGSSSSSAIRRRGPYIPIILYPSYGKLVKRSISGTREHNVWIYYRCYMHGHGCVFWHWELEYVGYLVNHDILRGDAAVEAIGWTEERREELNLRHAEREATRDAGAMKEKMLKNIEALVDAVKKMLFFLKCVLSVLCVLCVMIIMKK